MAALVWARAHRVRECRHAAPVPRGLAPAGDRDPAVDRRRTRAIDAHAADRDAAARQLCGVASLYLAWTLPVLLMAWLVDGTPEFTCRRTGACSRTGGGRVLRRYSRGLAPALESMRVDVLESLKGRRSMLGALVGSRLRGALIVTQVALSFVLLVGASLFLVTHYRTVTREVGLETSHVLMPRVGYRAAPGAPAPPGPAALKTILDRTTRRAAEWCSRQPRLSLADRGSTSSCPMRSRYRRTPTRCLQDSSRRWIFRFSAARARRADLPCRHGSCPVVVSQALARRLFAGAEAVGRTARSTREDVRDRRRRRRHIGAAVRRS